MPSPNRAKKKTPYDLATLDKAKTLDALLAMNLSYYTQLGNAKLAELPLSERRIPPTIMFIGHHPGEVFIQYPDFDDDAAKQQFAATTRSALAAEWSAVVRRYVLMSEAWMIMRSALSTSMKCPSTADDKIEVIMINIQDRGGAFIDATYELVRDWGTGHVTALKPIDCYEGDGKETGVSRGGLMSDLFQERTL